jgi:two-component system, NarL family, sensor histidine kinase UhpB
LKNILKILHLEDVSFDVEMVERELKKGNIIFEKLVVDNKVDFENALDNFLPDIILSDHSLPSFDSSGALELVKQKAPNTPFILVTATVSEEFAVNVLQRGASDYILKSNLKRLPSAVINAIEKSKMILDKAVAEQELKHSYEQVRKLASHLQDIREEERAFMAREIHDELGQQLTALKLDISWMILKLTGADDAIREKVQNMENMISVSLKTVKKLATELHPALLDKLGIIEAIKWQSREFEKRTNIKLELILPEEPVVLSTKTAIALFRIYQESLTNILRHAGAANVSCKLVVANDHVTFIIKDDGVGFDITEIEKKQSLGLLGMKERTVMIGGKYEIISEPDHGTTVSVILPVNELHQ